MYQTLLYGIRTISCLGKGKKLCNKGSKSLKHNTIVFVTMTVFVHKRKKVAPLLDNSNAMLCKVIQVLEILGLSIKNLHIFINVK